MTIFKDIMLCCVVLTVDVQERLDFSCAMFGPNGGLVANAPHIPVHLGAMQEAVQYQVSLFFSCCCVVCMFGFMVLISIIPQIVLLSTVNSSLCVFMEWDLTQTPF